MLTLVEYAETTSSRPFDKLKYFMGGGAAITQDSSLGVRLLRISLPEGNERAARTASRRAARLGMGKIVYPAGFPYKSEFECLGAREPETEALYKELAFDICAAAAETHGICLRNANVAVYMNRLTRQAEKAVLSLCGTARHISLLAERGADGFIGAMRREYGVSLIGRPIASLLEDTDLFLMLDKPRHLPSMIKASAVAVALYAGELPEAAHIYIGAEPAIPRGLREAWPRGCDSRALTAALFESGALKAEALELQTLIPANMAAGGVY